MAKFYTDFEWYKEYTGSFLYNYAYEFIAGLAPIETRGYQYFELANPTAKDIISRFINCRILGKLNRIFKTKFAITLEREMPICMDTKNAEQYAREFMLKVLNEFRTPDKPHLLIKHLCPPDIPEICLPYLPNDFRQISVNRDPRDLYILGKLNKTSDFPCRTVQEFVIYYKGVRDRQKPNTQVLFVNFEDLCYRYEDTVNIIQRFISIVYSTI